MCGIAGIYAFSGREPERQELERMSSALEHRGPDDSGIHLSGKIGLAHRRLSIIDIATGRQPLANEDGTVQIVFNGEIYNFMEIRKRLEAAGHRFRTNSDTETLVHLYEEKGVEMLHELRGIFAFIIWDAKRERLFACRDRFGEKPVVWAEREGRLYIASEIASLLAALPGPVEPDPLALYRFMVFQAPVAPLTILKGVNRLPAGSRLICEKGSIRVEKWWSPPKPETILDERDAERLFWEKLVDAVKAQQISERPLGFFLSGGIDSTLVVAAAREAGVSDIKTFSVIFPGTPFDESEYSDEAAKRLETNHHRVQIDFDVKETLALLMRRFGEPFGDPSCVPTYAVSKAAKEHVTVVLSGDGGDEVAGGYRTYIPLQLARLFTPLPEFMQDALSAGFGMLGRPEGRRRIDRAARLLSVISKGEARRSFAYWRTKYPMAMADRLLTNEMKPTARDLAERGPVALAAAAADLADPVEGARRCDINIQLADVFCPKVDICSAANALEVREPFLDPALCEWAERHLPSSLRVKGKVTKVVSKRALARYFPQDFIHRKKAGFTPPLGDWFRGANAEWSREILCSTRAAERGWFKRDEVERLVNDHQAGTRDCKEILFLLLVIEMWALEILDGRTFNG